MVVIANKGYDQQDFVYVITRSRPAAIPSRKNRTLPRNLNTDRYKTDVVERIWAKAKPYRRRQPLREDHT
ncbi:unnamed protein product [Gemmata massiliana]|uniref:Transposase n=1 Tax=Gemmata massiliana TaxID=1210884 RepID=A0A6P2D1R2_9BACT|nr:unnamed protein product [Gemmata massiliana]